MKIYFFPHKYMRDRQLDTIARWPDEQAYNKASFKDRKGAQVSAAQAVKKKKRTLKEMIPLINLKRISQDCPKDATVYVWGGIILNRDYILELDNPFVLTGYNIGAMSLYKGIIRKLLKRKNCKQIRCMSKACQESVRTLFGEDVFNKTIVEYPKIPKLSNRAKVVTDTSCRFLFISTQFEIKGGDALLKAFTKLRKDCPNAELDLITHLPNQFRERTKIEGLHVHPANFSRQEIWDQFMDKNHVLIHPTYIDSFGLVALEALSYGMGIICSDIYALRELVEPERNGSLIKPPISHCDGVMPGILYKERFKQLELIRAAETEDFVNDLYHAMKKFAQNPEYIEQASQRSLEIYDREFSF